MYIFSRHVGEHMQYHEKYIHLFIYIYIYDIPIGEQFTKVNVHNILSNIGSVSREVSNHITESTIF